MAGALGGGKGIGTAVGASGTTPGRGREAEDLQRTPRGLLTAGSPVASATFPPASGTDPMNGWVGDMAWSWVRQSITAADTLVAFDHNLNAPLLTGTYPNVAWLVWQMWHDGTGADAASTLSLNYETGDSASITVNSMPLRLYVGGTRTVDADHPVTVTLIFQVVSG